MPKIKIEKELYARLRDVAEKAGYSSVEEFVAHVLEKAASLSDVNDNDDKVMERLKGLGYIS